MFFRNSEFNKLPARVVEGLRGQSGERSLSRLRRGAIAKVSVG